MEGIENPTSSVNPIHDFSQQEKGFGYMSAFIDNSTRLSLLMGTAINAYEIPDVPGQPIGQMGNPPVTTAYGVSGFNSAQLNENQVEVTHYGVWRCRNPSMTLTVSSPISPATTICNSRRMSSAICC